MWSGTGAEWDDWLTGATVSVRNLPNATVVPCETDFMQQRVDGAGSSSRRRVIALTGGIGSGKTAVGHILSDQGAFVVDADDVARTVTQPNTAGHAAVVKAFGPEVLGANDYLDRAKLAGLVFADDAKRSLLEGIVHPLVELEAGRRFQQAHEGAVLVYEIPLLAETGSGAEFAGVVVVDCPDELRLARLTARGLSEADATARMSAQSSRADRLAIADFVIDNSGTPADLRRRTEALWPSLVELVRGSG